MKKILFVFGMMFYTSIVAAQNPPNPGDNVLDPGLDKFIGTWQWANGNDTIRILLKKENIHFPIGDYHGDVLIGFHIYKKGNVVVESSFDYISTSYTQKHHSVVVYGSESDKVGGTLNDLSKNKVDFIRFIISPSLTQLEWVLSSTGTYTGPSRPGFTLPTNIVLTKL